MIEFLCGVVAGGGTTAWVLALVVVSRSQRKEDQPWTSRG